MKTVHMIQKAIGLYLLALVAMACSKDGNNDSIPSGDKLLLTETKVDGTIEARYEYDGDGRLVKTHSYADDGSISNTLTYTYGGNDQLISVEMRNGEDEVDYTEIFSYGENGKPASSRIVIGAGGPDNTWSTTYTYHSNKIIERTVILDDYITETTYTSDSKGNTLTVETRTQGEWSATTEFGDYDDKNAPGANGNPYIWKYSSVNNHRLQKTSTAYGTGDQEWVFKYDYNNSGYPTKMEKYTKSDEQLIETYTYSYKSGN